VNKFVSRICPIVMALSLVFMVFSSFSFVGAVSLYEDVQISVQTSSSLPDSFTFNAFNMTGFMIASYQTHYPAASFQLLKGQYIFTVSASSSSNQIYAVPLSGTVAPSVASSSNAVLSAPNSPIYSSPVVEYGYTVQQISGSTTFTVSTMNVTSFPTNTLSIKVAYVNGTAAEGASVTASVLGANYYWGYQNGLTLWATTDANGVANLVTPVAPVQLDAWSWLPVNLPQSQSTVQVNVGGETVNVTVYWQPSYVGLAGSAIIVPTESSASMTLHIQQSNYWVVPYTGAASLAKLGSSSASSPGSIPASVVQAQTGNPLLQNYQPSTGTSSTVPTPIVSPSPETTLFPTGGGQNTNIEILLVLAIVALVVAAAGLLLAVRIRRTRQPNDPIV
jgi:hypothetical protein